jgi:UPF0716 protein FxsA
MGLILFVIFIVIPIVELWVIIRVGIVIGFLPTLALLILVSVAGTMLMKQQGLATWRRLQQALERGEMPTKEVTDGALILLGGALLLTPGFVTDIVGLFLLFPVTRALVKGAVRTWLYQRAIVRAGFGGDVARDVYDTRVVRERREPTNPVSPDPTLPAGPYPDDEDGSPDTG